MIRFKYCPKCNALFDCYCDSVKTCWCNEVKISQKTLALLSDTYDGCLCPACLKGFNTTEKKYELIENIKP